MDNYIPISPVSVSGANDNNGFSLQSSPFFNGLPLMLQETILQSGVKVENEDDLKRLVDNIYNQFSYAVYNAY